MPLAMMVASMGCVATAEHAVLPGGGACPTGSVFQLIRAKHYPGIKGIGSASGPIAPPPPALSPPRAAAVEMLRRLTRHAWRPSQDFGAPQNRSSAKRQPPNTQQQQ